MADREHVEKVRGNFYIPLALMEAARDCVVALQGIDEHVSLGTLATRALATEIKRLQRKYNNGKPFPKRKRPPPKGRPWNS